MIRAPHSLCYLGRRERRAAAAVLAGLLAVGVTLAGEPARPATTTAPAVTAATAASVTPPPPANPFTVAAVLARVPPLKYGATARWPLVTWEPFRETAGDGKFEKGEPLPDFSYRELARRGLGQAIRLNASFIPMALAIQRAGCPVIIMEGWSGNGPGGDAADALHHLPKDFEIPKGEKHYPCPMLTEGWMKHAGLIRQTLQQFSDAGVTVNAVWLDWEVEPVVWTMERWQQARFCSRCQEMLPKGALRTPFRYRDFVTPLRQQLLSAFVARPVLDVFPRASVSNWETFYSSEAEPVWNWWGDTFPVLEPGQFTATMPAAYGSNAIFTDFWHGFWGAPIRHLRNNACLNESLAKTDRAYTYVMLAAVSADAANATRAGEGKRSVPWVSRYVQDNERLDTPILSRERYREILRHLWLRGAMGMQVFNSFNPHQPDFILQEVEDAVRVYGEMQPWCRFLDKGTVMNTESPSFQDTAAIWSGLRLNNEALVRVFVQDDKPTSCKIRPWPDGSKIKLTAPPEGATYLLIKDADGDVEIRAAQPTP